MESNKLGFEIKMKLTFIFSLFVCKPALCGLFTAFAVIRSTDVSMILFTFPHHGYVTKLTAVLEFVTSIRK